MRWQGPDSKVLSGNWEAGYEMAGPTQQGFEWEVGGLI